MTRYNMKAVAIDAICALLILLFVYAAASKLADVERFKAQLSQSPVLTFHYRQAAYLVPVIEILISVLLFTSRWRWLGLYGSYLLLVMFTAYIFIITTYSETIPCSCGGVLQNMSWKQHFSFNLVFTFLSGAAAALLSTLPGNPGSNRNPSSSLQ